MQVHVPQLNVQHAGLQSIDIGQVSIGPITVGSLVLNNADFSMSAAQATLQSVSVQMSIHVSVTWAVHVGMPDGIPDINIGDTYDLGSLNFPSIGVGDIVIPGLNNIHVHIPSLTAQNMSVAAEPLTLQLHNATADQISAANTVLPTAGFSMAGLTLNSLQGTDVAVPAAQIDHAAVGHLHGDAVAIPSFSLNTLNLPAAQIPTVSSSAPLDIPATLSTQSIGFDAGILRLTIDLTPSAQSHIDHLEITGASATATVGQVVLHNVTLPYDVLNLTLSQVGITSMTIPAFNAS